MGTWLVAAVLTVTPVAATACGGGGASPSASSGGQTSLDKSPLPAGPTPSAIAKQVCDRTAQAEIASALGVRATVSTPTWQDHLYRCVYSYPDGSFALSVKELSSWSQTLAYYHQQGTSLGVTRTLPNLGQGAVQVTDGSVVVRKDWKVLLVDVTGLPATFGVPPSAREYIAVTIADVILGCWAGD